MAKLLGPSKHAARTERLRMLARQQVTADEGIEFDGLVGSQYVAVTEWRIVVAKSGLFTGERTETIPIATINGIIATRKAGTVQMLQLAITGRTGGLVLYDGDVSELHHALIAQMARIFSSVWYEARFHNASDRASGT